MQDLGFCTPSVASGHRYRLTEWYKSSAPVYFNVARRDNLGAFYFWMNSPSFPPASSWTQATWVTPVIPTGLTGLSGGLTLASNGFLTVDDVGFDDAAATGSGDITPPAVTLTSPAAGSTVTGAVTVSANASDNLAVDHVDLLVDGQVDASASSGPFTFTWDSRDVTNGAHTLAVRAVDTSSNSTTSSSVTVTVSNLTVNVLQNPSLEAATNNVPTCWGLGGFGTNTFTWTRTYSTPTREASPRSSTLRAGLPATGNSFPRKTAEPVPRRPCLGIPIRSTTGTKPRQATPSSSPTIELVPVVGSTGRSRRRSRPRAPGRRPRGRPQPCRRARRRCPSAWAWGPQAPSRWTTSGCTTTRRRPIPPRPPARSPAGV